MTRTRFTRPVGVLLATAAFLSTAVAQSLAVVRPPLAMSQQVVPAASSVFTGAFGFVFTITVTSTVPLTGYPIMCTASVSPIDVDAIFTSDSETVLAVRNGSTATCSFPIRYAWNLSSGSTMVNTTYIVEATGTSASLFNRVSAGALPSVALPANAASLWRTINVTL